MVRTTNYFAPSPLPRRVSTNTNTKSNITSNALHEKKHLENEMVDTMVAKPIMMRPAPTLKKSLHGADGHSPHKTTATASPTKKQGGAWETLQVDLQRYTRANDRRMAIRALTDCKRLRTIPIDGNPAAPNSQNEWKSLEREVCFTTIELNGLVFPAASTSQILKVLQELCRELCRDVRLSHESIYQAMIVRLARTTSSADSYFQLNALLGSQDLVLQPRKAPAPVTKLVMYESDGSIHVVSTTYHPYGLFRRCDVTSGKAWIPLLAAIHERVNFLTGDCFRHVGVQVASDSS